jgi:hypothetical protein
MPAMFLLISNIGVGFVGSGNTNAKCAVTFLPFKGTQPWKGLVNPSGRISFEQLNRFRNGNSRWQRNQYVDMIARSAKSERFHLILLRDAAEVWPKPLLYIRTE